MRNICVMVVVVVSLPATMIRLAFELRSVCVNFEEVTGSEDRR